MQCVYYGHLIKNFQIREILKEFLSTSDSGEVARCIRELDVPHYHHEIGKYHKTSLILGLYYNLKSINLIGKCIFSLRRNSDRIGKLSKWNGSEFNGLASSIFIHQRGKSSSTHHHWVTEFMTVLTRIFKTCFYLNGSCLKINSLMSN